MLELFRSYHGRYRTLTIVAASVTLLGAVLAARSSAQAAAGPAIRIVGGENVSEQQGPAYTAMAALVLSDQVYQGSDADRQFCGGSLIAAQVVLTAAHCVLDSSGATVTVSDIEVVLGKRDLAAPSGGEHLAVARIQVPASYRRTRSPDVAVVTLASPSAQTPIGLVSRSVDWRPGTRSRVAGWGLTREGGKPSHVLRHVSIPILRGADCRRAYGSSFRSTSMLCAGALKGGKDSCQGDSGGPLMVRGQDRQLLLAGVVSWGNGCARRGFPGIYARVGATRVQSWIALAANR
jgi:secreted trypsin-like serine protease